MFREDDETSSDRLPHRSIKPGDFPLGSSSSRAAARMLLSRRKQAASREADIRIVFDLASGPCRGKVSRTIDPKGVITDIIFPVHDAKEECYGVFAVPRGIDLEEALRQARERQVESARSNIVPQGPKHSRTTSTIQEISTVQPWKAPDVEVTPKILVN